MANHRSAKPTPARQETRRCAIYTRKSSEEGLEQAFNSLDAQRDACEHYARSQRHEGWTILPTFYDDGGISGGTLGRPALKRLLADVRAGKVDLILVYKVDRLTRSLPDFAKIVEVLDAHGASFVSVTQHFNTATSMGRLTLNMLLSFAQFEREVAGERIRDKIAASKRKGMWMGGNLPLGYDVRDRKLVVNEAEAARVRQIFCSYVELGSVRLLREHVVDAGIVGKSGTALTRGALFHLLQNRIYLGEVSHKGDVYRGEHAAIVEQEVWQAVQHRLSENRHDHASGAKARSPSLLAGLVFDQTGQALTATHATKHGQRYRYYISRDLVRGQRAASSDGLRLPAAELERVVMERLLQLLSDRKALLGALSEVGAVPQDAADQLQVLTKAEQMATGWAAMTAGEQRTRLATLLRRIEVGRSGITLHLVPEALVLAMQGRGAVPGADAATLLVTIPTALRRAGKEMALIVGADAVRVDPALLRLISKARTLREALVSAPDTTLTAVAANQGLSRAYASGLLRLAWLAPEIVQAILEGRQPASLTATRLVKGINLPMDWKAQRAALAFA